MRYVKLGMTGLQVSAIALGCMSFGEPDRGGEPWSLGADASRDIIKQALESGVNFLDTANGYSAGSSEEQDHYNLIHREAEREMLPLCADQGIGVLPWSPLARGRLTRARETATARAETDAGGRILYRDGDQAVAERVHEIAGRGVDLPPGENHSIGRAGRGARFEREVG
ncbi:aldo/keto reductase [Streptomyces sp. PU-14G]|uniref:aldo/keto reductase n=1 Tax=Streptomyces sp. PU-14G TaxID=2800808 RepID=UPI0034DDED97